VEVQPQADEIEMDTCSLHLRDRSVKHTSRGTMRPLHCVRHIRRGYGGADPQTKRGSCLTRALEYTVYRMVGPPPPTFLPPGQRAVPSHAILFVSKRLLSTGMSTFDQCPTPPKSYHGMGCNGARKLSSDNVASMVRSPFPRRTKRARVGVTSRGSSNDDSICGGHRGPTFTEADTPRWWCIPYQYEYTKYGSTGQTTTAGVTLESTYSP
jgi:hypothetical protein